MLLPSIYLLFISPKWQHATVLHKSKPQIERGRLVKMAINSRETLLLKRQKFRSDRFGKITWGLKIKVVKIPQELVDSEPQSYPKRQRER